MTRKTSKVEPLGYHGNINQSASPHPKYKSDEKQAKLGKGSWNKVITLFSQLVCTEPERGDGEVIRSKEKVVSMYGELSDSDHQTPPSSPLSKPKHHHRSEFKEVVFTLQDEHTTNPRDAKLTIPITALPKPNECNEMAERRTNVEILQELNDKGLVGDAQPSVGDAPPSPMVLESIKPGGVSFEIRVTTVRPRTAKGQRVPRPPRRLESLKEVEAINKRNKDLSAKIKEKQEKATLKRQVLQEMLQQMRNEKSQKIKQAVEAIADASEKKKVVLAEKMAEREERAEAVRQDIQKRRQELARKSNQLSLGDPGEMSPVDDETLDRISTYNGSDESCNLLTDNTDYLKSVKGEDKYDDFYDGPNQDTYTF